METFKSKTAPQRLVTHLDYINTKESIEYCKVKLPVVRPKIPYQFARPIRKILLANGFDYPLHYIRACIKVSRTVYNVHIVQAAEKLVANMEDPCQREIHYDPEVEQLRHAHKKPKVRKSIMESQRLVKA